MSDRGLEVTYSTALRALVFLTAFLLLTACAGVNRLTEQPSPMSMASGLPRSAEQQVTRIDRAVLRFRVDPRKRHVEGDALLTISTTEPLQMLVLDLDRRLDIRSIELDGSRVKESRWRNPDGRLHVELSEALEVETPLQVRIRYGGSPRQARQAPFDGAIVWGRTSNGSAWIATALQGEGCDLLWPCIDHPAAEPGVVEQYISVPAPLVAVANGIDLGMTEHAGWRTYGWRARHPNTYAIALNIGPYVHLQDNYQSRYGNVIPLHFWHLPEHAVQARRLFGEFGRMLDFFEQMIGPYPFGDEKMGVVQTPHLGMEHQTINAYGNEYKLDAYGFDWLLHHEFAHEWFGNQVTNADWDDLWLHESFAAYMEALYAQWLHGEMAYQARLFDQRKRVRNLFPIVSGRTQCGHVVYHAEHGPGGDLYDKGSLVLHSLRQLIGDRAFFEAIRRLVYGTTTPLPGNFVPRFASTRDFIADVNAAAGADFGWFFDAYLYQAALPTLLVDRDDSGVTLRWTQPAQRPFPMPVEVGVNSMLQTLDLTAGSARFAATANDQIIIDPASKLFRALTHLDDWQAQQDAETPRGAIPLAADDPCLQMD